MAIYHLKAAVGKRGTQSAAAKASYIGRAGKYRERKGDDEVVLVESGNMPDFATAGRSEKSDRAALAYWRAADEHERANGKLFYSLEFALPVELSKAEQI